MLTALLFSHILAAVPDNYFWQITDMHISPSSADNLEVIQSAIKLMKQVGPNPKFIGWTGDTLSHDACLHSSTDLYEIYRNITSLLTNNFPNSVIIPTLGNHDACPSDYWPTNNSSFYQQFLHNTSWAELINGKEFLKGGYYSKRISETLIIVAINSVLWITPNQEASAQSDPADQFQWLTHVLQKAQRRNDSVFILAHVPLGHEPNISRPYNVQRLNIKFVEILSKFDQTITGMFCGHLHHSAIFADPRYFSRAIYAAPALSRVNGNPGIRQYFYDPATNEMSDYRQYYLSRHGEWIWRSQSSLYSVNGNKAATVLKAVNDNFGTYIEQFTYSDVVNNECDRICARSLHCSMSSLSPNEYATCLTEDLVLHNC